MVQPGILNPHPPVTVSIVAGAVATLLQSALIHLAEPFGFPFVDVPRLIGGIFTADPDVALWIGYWLYFIGGVLVVAPLFPVVWPMLPGPGVGFRGALVKGPIGAVLLWIAWGLLLPVLGALTQVAGPGLDPGFFALAAGPLGAIGLFLGQLAYALALALVASMTYGIFPLDAIGWTGYDLAIVTGVEVRRP